MRASAFGLVAVKREAERPQRQCIVITRTSSDLIVLCSGLSGHSHRRQRGERGPRLIWLLSLVCRMLTYVNMPAVSLELKALLSHMSSRPSLSHELQALRHHEHLSSDRSERALQLC